MGFHDFHCGPIPQATQNPMHRWHAPKSYDVKPQEPQDSKIQPKTVTRFISTSGNLKKMRTENLRNDSICWWFQPSWKIWIKMGIFPKDRGGKKHETTTQWWFVGQHLLFQRGDVFFSVLASKQNCENVGSFLGVWVPGHHNSWEFKGTPI